MKQLDIQTGALLWEVEVDVCSNCYNEEEGVIFSGDTMFKNSHGRVDFPTGSGAEMSESLTRLVNEFPGNVKVYSGHTEVTTLAGEKAFLTFNGII